MLRFKKQYLRQIPLPDSYPKEGFYNEAGRLRDIAGKFSILN
jgi:hypothetical protein